MADFCRECSVELFGIDTKDMVSTQLTPAEFNKGKITRGICEGCAGGMFAPDGTCQGACMNPQHGNGEIMRHTGGIGFIKEEPHGS